MNQAGTQQIQTKRLLLRRFEYGDRDAVLHNWAADREMQALYSEPAYQTPEAVHELLESYIQKYDDLGYYRWAAVSRESGECIGQIAYFLVDQKNHFAEIEYCIGRRFQNRGLATEATKAVIAYGFEVIGLHKVQICHKSINLPSKRVIEKCGFHYDGTLRDYFYMDGTYVDRLYYSILETEFHPA